jgi:uncharacterized membrane protein YhhN
VFLAVRLGALESGYGLWVLAGLSACWFGDVLLIPERQAAFKVGIASFLAGHLAYSIAFLIVVVSMGWVALVAAPIGLVAWFVGRLLLERVEPFLRRAVAAYILVISAMLTLGAGVWGRSGEWVFLAAPGAFYVSNLAVARNRFVAPGFVNRLIGLPLYYSAQVLFAWSVTLV